MNERLHQIPLERARRQRYFHGRQERGLRPGDPFQGDALAEAHEEIVDALNYVAEARLAGRANPLVLDHLERVFTDAAELLAAELARLDEHPGSA